MAVTEDDLHIIEALLPDDQYINEAHDKWAIILHHTASDSNPFGVVEWWKKVPDRVATAFIIAGKPHGSTARYKDGSIIQCFGSNKAAWHLGTKQSHYPKGLKNPKSSSYLNLNSVGLEICNWGPLEETADGFKNYEGGIVPDADVYTFDQPFRHHLHYHRYTAAQLDSTKKLIQYLSNKYNIPMKYDPNMFDICGDAFEGKSQIWTHCSFRPYPDKFDLNPQKELLDMLDSL